MRLEDLEFNTGAQQCVECGHIEDTHHFCSACGCDELDEIAINDEYGFYLHCDTIYDEDSGDDGVATPGTGTFSAATAAFREDNLDAGETDVGKSIRIQP